MSDGVSAPRWRVDPPDRGDLPRWRTLYRGYASFYEAEVTETSLATLWGWLLDPGHPCEARLVRDGSGEPMGFAHFRPFPRPLSGNVGCFLDDLYVDPPARGTGAADALLDALAHIAADRSWSVVRWITDQDNARARALYDRVAERTRWVTYDMAPSATR